MVKKFIDYIKGNDENNDIVKIQFSKKFLDFITLFKNENNFAKIIYDLYIGVSKDILNDNFPNYLDVDDEYNASFLKSRYSDEIDVWLSTRRTKIKMTKLAREFYKLDYLEKNIKNTDIEDFSNKINAMKSGIRIVELRGDDILRAFNYNQECHSNFGHTCANFHQKEGKFGGYLEPSVSWYDIYTKNPDNCGVVISLENGVICGRRTFQQGINLVDDGKFKKDSMATVYGNYYGLNGSGSKYDVPIVNYLKEKYDAVSMTSIDNVFVININTRFEQYCPFDFMSVSFEHNLLTNNPNLVDRLLNKRHGWSSAYKARCPNKYLN